VNLRQKTLSGMFWSFLERFSSQIIQFVVGIILARILLPEEFGLIGMIAVFIALGTSLTDSGLTSSLIRTPDAGDEDYSTVFFTNLGASILIYCLIYLLAPHIASFFNQEMLVGIVRVYCLTFIFRAFSAVQSTRLTAAMDFRTQMLVQLPSLVGGGITGIALAYAGFGVWSLVYMQLVQTALSTIQLWMRTGWVPRWVYNVEKLKYHFDFGYKLTLSGIIDTIYQNIYHIVIGKYFSAAQLGFYTRAQAMKQLPVSNISSSLNRVTYPMFTAIQDDDVKLKSVYQRMMQQVLFWVAPILIIGGVLAEPLFRFLLTEKWLPAVPYFQILCFVGIMYPLHSYNLNILKVKGRSDLFLRLEIVKKSLITIGLVFAIPFGIYGLLWMQVFLTVVAFLINTHYSGKLIDYPALDQVKDLAPVFGIAILAGLITLAFDSTFSGILHRDLIRLVAGTVTGMLTYLGLSTFLKLRALTDFRQIVMQR
jgi:O-antigen/teichoic acid export membrane protein